MTRLRFVPVVVFLLCLVLLGAWTPVSAAPPAQGITFPAQGTVNANANLRAGPGTTYDRTGSAQAGQTVQIVECNDGCTWYKLPDGAWIFAELVQMQSGAAPSAAQTTEQPAPAAAAGATAADTANLRSGPGTRYARLGGATAGQPLDVKGRNEAGDWYKLSDGSWIAAFLVNGAPGDLPVVDSANGAQPASGSAPEATPTPGFFILDFTNMYGKSVAEAEAVLGTPELITEFAAGDSLEAIPDGGEERDYNYQGVALSADYDRQGILRGLNMGSALASGHDLSYYQIAMKDWRKVLRAVGLPTSASPDKTYPTMYEWEDMGGYRIRMAADVDGAWWLLVTMEAK